MTRIYVCNCFGEDCVVFSNKKAAQSYCNYKNQHLPNNTSFVWCIIEFPVFREFKKGRKL